jgi:hypothetical protein
MGESLAGKYLKLLLPKRSGQASGQWAIEATIPSENKKERKEEERVDCIRTVFFLYNKTKQNRKQ